jgi:hypothetical protein
MGNPFIIAEDNALKTLVQGMLVSDQKNATRPVKVWFGFPDVEIRDQDFPFATIDLIDIMPANDRQHQGTVVDTDYRGTTAPSAGNLYTYDYPVAYDLIYQVATFARHPRHDRAIMFQMLNKFPSKYGKLPVPNELGTETSYRSMFLDGFTKRDVVEGETGNRRTLRNVFTIRVVSEMTPAQAIAATPSVDTILINTTTTNIPSNYQPLNNTSYTAI